jgi:alpha-tubulin suppressor-like RCC1 family protein
LTVEGEVYTWGFGGIGTLGHGNREHRLHPTLVEATSNMKIKQVCCGVHHTAGLAENGQLYTWGSNRHGKLGQGLIRHEDENLEPALVKGLGHAIISAVSCGEDHMAAVTDTGVLYYW